MNSDESKLNSLLRDVDVPIDLKDRLRQIPEESRSVLPQPHEYQATIRRRTFARRVPRFLAIVSIIAGVGVFFLWPSPMRDVPSASNVKIASLKNSQDALDRINESADRIQNVLLQLKTKNLEKRLFAIQSANDQWAQGSSSRINSSALILTLANQSAIRMGVEQSTLQPELESVIKEFPTSYAAVLAEEILRPE